MKPLLSILFDALSSRLAQRGHTISLDETTVWPSILIRHRDGLHGAIVVVSLPDDDLLDGPWPTMLAARLAADARITAVEVQVRRESVCITTPVFVHRIVADGEPCFGGVTQQAGLLVDEVQTVVRMRSGELINALWEMDDRLTHVGTSRIAAIIERGAIRMRVDHALGKSDEEHHAEAQLSIIRHKRKVAQRKAAT